MPVRNSSNRHIITSKLTSNARTTIPLPVRKALRLIEGDEIVYLVEGDCVFLSKVNQEPIVDPFATFSEMVVW